MKIELSGDEVKAIIYEWAAAKFPSQKFNMMEIESGYSFLSHVTLSYDKAAEGASEAKQP